MNNSKSKALPSLKYLEGEVIWAKFNRRPWWPCRVSADPALETYHRIKGMLISVKEKKNSFHSGNE